MNAESLFLTAVEHGAASRHLPLFPESKASLGPLFAWEVPAHVAPALPGGTLPGDWLVAQPSKDGTPDLATLAVADRKAFLSAYTQEAKHGTLKVGLSSLVLSEESKGNLLSAVKAAMAKDGVPWPEEAKTLAHHVTLGFNVSRRASDFLADKALVGQPAVIGYSVDSEKKPTLVAAVVEIAGSVERHADGKVLHVTMALAGKRRPEESNAVIANQGWKPLNSVLPLEVSLEFNPHSESSKTAQPTGANSFDAGNWSFSQERFYTALAAFKQEALKVWPEEKVQDAAWLLAISDESVKKAFTFQVAAHEGQVRKFSEVPVAYAVHPTEVWVELVKRNPQASVPTQQAALLHDTVEDTPARLSDIGKEFGSETARKVEQLTDQTLPADGSRRIRMGMNAAHAAKADSDIKDVKVLDSLLNVRDIAANNPAFGKVYVEEKKGLLTSLKGATPALLAELSSALRVVGAEVEKALAYPDLGGRQVPAYFPMAPSGAGKSTLFSAMVAADPSLVKFSLDDFLLKEHGGAVADRKADYAQAWKKSFSDSSFIHRSREKFQEMLRDGRPVFVDNTNLGKDAAWLVAEAKLAGYTPIGLTFDVKLEDLLARQNSRSDKSVPEDSVRQQFDKWKTTSPEKLGISEVRPAKEMLASLTQGRSQDR